MPKYRPLHAFLALAAALAVPGCRRAAGVPVPMEVMRRAPLQVRLDEETLVLEAFLWRDFMPAVPAGGRPLTAVLRLRAMDGSMSSGITADSAWIFKGGEVWATAVRQEQPREFRGELDLVARGGPLWEPGSEVDVVIRVRSRGTPAFIRAAGQRIRRTD